MGKVIAITGAGDGLGRALARRFAADGETLVLLGRTLSKIQAVADEIGPQHLAVECDVADPASVRAAFETVAAKYPKLDVLINNAAVFEPFTLAEVRDDQLVSQLMINFAGPVLCSREALPLLKGGGQIINVTSESVAMRIPMLWMYAGVKAGVELVSHRWAEELAPDGVRITIVQAGPMMDETKTGSPWPIEVAMKFGAECAKVGIDMRTRPISHYKSVTDAFRAVIDTAPDVHIEKVEVRAWRG